MSGYQEVLTDPSYAGQVVTMTYPHQGNYGINTEDPESSRVQVAGFAVREVNGHDVDELRNTLREVPFDSNKPSVIICHTVKGKGTSLTKGNLAWHHKAKVSETEVASLFASLDAE